MEQWSLGMRACEGVHEWMKGQSAGKRRAVLLIRYSTGFQCSSLGDGYRYSCPVAMACFLVGQLP